MAKVFRGLYRTRGVGGLPNRAYLTDGTMGFDVSEGRYHEKRYKPSFDRLPSKAEYQEAEGAKASAKTKPKSKGK